MATYDLRTGYPDTQRLVPHRILSDITSELLLNDRGTQYSGTLVGPVAEREALADFITQVAHDSAHPDHLLMASGALEAINIVTRTVAQPGDVLVVEDPTFFFVLRLFHAAHLTIETVPMTPDGLDLAALEALAQRYGERLAALYTIPSFHNPLGVTTQPAHRQALVRLAQQYDFTVIEDATYQWLHFDEAAPPLCSHYDDSDEHIVTVGTFSKIIMPAIRQGFIWSTPEQIKRFSAFKDFTVSTLNAGLLGEFIRRGHIHTQLENARLLYKEGRDNLCAALQAHLPDWVQWSRPDGGFFVWLTLPEQMQAEKLLEIAKTRDLDFMPGHAAFAKEVPDRYVRLSFTMCHGDDLHAAAQRLADCLNVLRDRLPLA
jgi:2-aminoadipate transaminase